MQQTPELRGFGVFLYSGKEQPGMKRMEEAVTAYMKEMNRSFYMEEAKEQADIDAAAPIGHGQTISQPSLVRKMTVELDPGPDMRVLEIGTGSGFQTAILAAFSEKVYTVERIEPLYQKAKERLRKAGFSNIEYRLGNGSDGWEQHAPFDRIIVTAAAASVPQALLRQLKPGGRMVIPVGNEFSQDLLLLEKAENGSVEEMFLCPVMFVKLYK